MAEFDLIGCDGLLLRRLVSPRAPRTSADLVIPILLSIFTAECRVALVGGMPGAAEQAKRAIERDWPTVRVVHESDGYAGLPPPRHLTNMLIAAKVDIVIIGLGAPHQDAYVLALREAGLSRSLILTCGGWLDQVSQSQYYPPFAYRFRINWLIRLIREPRRLWRRYTSEAIRALPSTGAFRAALLQQGRQPFFAMWAVCMRTCDSQSDRGPAITPSHGRHHAYWHHCAKPR